MKKEPAQKTIEINKWFDIVNVIFEKHTIPSDTDIQKHCNQYMISTLLSCDPQFVCIAQEMTKLKLTNKMYFDCLYYGIPKMKKYIKWNAGKEVKEKNIKYLMDYFRCSQNSARQYLTIISEEELKYIVDYNEKRGVKR